MTGPLVGVTVLQPASGTVARPVHDLFGAGDRSRWPADNTGRQGAPQPRPRSDIEADQRASPTQSSAGSTSAGTAPTSSKTARDPPGSSCPWPLSFPAKENQQMSTT